MLEKRKSRGRVLFVDDDLFVGTNYIDALRDDGFEVCEAEGVDSALRMARTDHFDVLVVDIMLPPGRSFSNMETQGGFKTGIALARRIREIAPEMAILALTMSTDPEVEEWFSSDEALAYADKREVLPHQLPRVLRNLVEGKSAPRVFIVHGRDSKAVEELKVLLMTKLDVPDPVVLAEQPSKGRTIIEKFEYYAQDVDLVFVLATGDDVGRLANPDTEERPRSRQNVVFELGYFLGTLKRSSGRVLLLYQSGVELPSDILGVVYIDITNGIASAESEIRRELTHWFASE